MSIMEVPPLTTTTSQNLDPLAALAGTEHLLTQALALLCSGTDLLECRLVSSSWRDLVTSMNGGVFFRRAKAQCGWSPAGGCFSTIPGQSGKQAVACKLVGGHVFVLSKAMSGYDTWSKRTSGPLKLEAFKLEQKKRSLDNPLILWERMNEVCDSSDLFVDGHILTVYTQHVDSTVFSSSTKFCFTRFDTRSLQMLDSFDVVNEDVIHCLTLQMEARVAMTGNHSLDKEIHHIMNKNGWRREYTDFQGNILITISDQIKGNLFIAIDKNTNKSVDRRFPTTASTRVLAYAHPVVLLHVPEQGLALWNLEAEGNPAAVWTNNTAHLASLPPCQHTNVLASPTKLFLTWHSRRYWQSESSDSLVERDCFRLPPPEAINVSGQTRVSAHADHNRRAYWLMQSDLAEFPIELTRTAKPQYEFREGTRRSWITELLDSSDWHLVYRNPFGDIVIADFWNV